MSLLILSVIINVATMSKFGVNVLHFNAYRILLK
jgi:hypothetical protein